jgi:hypothetical protein
MVAAVISFIFGRQGRTLIVLHLWRGTHAVGTLRGVENSLSSCKEYQQAESDAEIDAFLLLVYQNRSNQIVMQQKEDEKRYYLFPDREHLVPIEISAVLLVFRKVKYQYGDGKDQRPYHPIDHIFLQLQAILIFHIAKIIKNPFFPSG